MDNRETLELEIRWQWMDAEDEAMIDQMYQRWLAEQDLGEIEGDSLYW